MKFEIKELETLLAHVELHSSLSNQIKIVQEEDPQICKIMEEVKKEKADKLS